MSVLLTTMVCWSAEPTLNLEGTGTAASPYLIKTAADVQTLAAACNQATASSSGHYSGKYFRQTADIDMSGVSGFIGIGTAPADKSGSSSWSFQGIYDGGGFRIKNMTIKGLVYKEDGSVNTSTGANGSRRYIGFFGTLGSNASVSNLIIDESCSIEGYSYVGGICGYTSAGITISNCANFATIRVYDQYAAGIAGRFYNSTSKPGTIKNCYNAGKIIGYSYVGGIAGESDYATISFSANTGQIIGTNYYPGKSSVSSTRVGGIIGYASYSRCENCANYGDIFASKELAGGITGYAYENTSGFGGIVSCLNTGMVYANLDYLAGTIAGSEGSSTTALKTLQNNYYDATLANTLFGGNNPYFQNRAGIEGYSTGQLTSGNALIGLTNWVYKAGSYPIPQGLNYPELTTAAATYLTFPAGQDANLLTETATASTGVSAELYKASNIFTVSDNKVTAHPGLGNGKNAVKLTNGKFVRHVIVSTYTIPFSGDGTAASPYLINNKEDLINFQNLTNDMQILWGGKYIKMTADIDMAGETRFQGIGCTPDSISNLAPSYRYHFEGNFDGNGHKISNLVVNWVNFTADSTYIDWRKGAIYSNGFFGTLGKGAVIRNLTIDNTCRFTTYYYSGGLAVMARYGEATIENCHVGTYIKAYNRYVGGIIGIDNTEAPVKISNCSFSGTIEANYDYVGGIIGFGSNTESEITGCVNIGKINCWKFDKIAVGSNSTAQLNRIAGIAGALRGNMIGCASYGPIHVQAHPYDASKNKMLGLGGLAGQYSNYAAGKGLTCNFTSSQIYMTGEWADGQVQTGIIVGDYWRNASLYGSPSANYCDTTLNYQSLILGNLTPDTLAAPNAFHGMTTSELTSGAAIDSLKQYFNFEAGYYPIPKPFAANADVRAAACTFFNVSMANGGNIKKLIPGAVCPFNDVMPLTGTLSSDEVFYIKNNSLKQRNVEQMADDILMLTNGAFSTFYPVHKVLGLGVDGIANDGDIIVSTEYYTPAGLRVATPAPGTTVIAISKTISGKRIVIKTVMR